VTGISDMRDASSVFLAWMRVPGREPSNALHATLGWQQDLWGGLGWSIEGYYKDLGKVPVPVWTSRAQFNTDIVLGDGQVRGADLRLELNRPEVYGFIGYGYSWTEYESAQDHFGVWFGEPVQRYHPAHDRRHQVNAMLSFDIAGFTTGVRWQ